MQPPEQRVLLEDVLRVIRADTIVLKIDVEGYECKVGAVQYSTVQYSTVQYSTDTDLVTARRCSQTFSTTTRGNSFQ